MNLWGNDFNGSTGIGYNNSHRANLAYVGSISMNSSISGCTNIDDIAYFKSSKLGINTGSTDPAYTLDVAGTIRVGSTSYANLIGISNQYLELGSNGNEMVISGGQSDTIHVNYRGSGLSKSIPASWQWHAGTGSSWADFVLGTLEAKTSIKIGSITIKNENGGLHIIGGGLYTDTYLSALGTGSGGSGGGSDFGFALNGTTLSVGTNTSVDLGSKFVTLGSAQNIIGPKTFINNMSVNANLACSLQITCTNERVSTSLTVGSSTLNTGYNLYVNGTSYFTNTSNFLGNICIGAAGSSSLQLDMRKNKIVLGNIFLRSVGDTVYFDATDADEGYVRGYGGCTIVSGSDMRQKNVVETAECDLESVARAPIFNFTWKNTKKNVLHLGSSAQYWKNIFPCATPLLDDGYYSMDYGATALAAAVMTARTVLTHDEEIARLKRRIGELEQEIETLKAA